jgi:hypothetical protein
MSDLTKPADAHPLTFGQRWSQRKHQQADKTAAARAQTPLPIQHESPPVLRTEQELPPLESLHEDSEVSMFLDEGVSESLQRLALRRLFHMGKFNICDGLDDYADDYSVFNPLSDIVQARQQLQRLSQQFTQPQPETDAETTTLNTNESPPDTPIVETEMTDADERTES